MKPFLFSVRSVHFEELYDLEPCDGFRINFVNRTGFVLLNGGDPSGSFIKRNSFYGLLFSGTQFNSYIS